MATFQKQSKFVSERSFQRRLSAHATLLLNVAVTFQSEAAVHSIFVMKC